MIATATPKKTSRGAVPVPLQRLKERVELILQETNDLKELLANIEAAGLREVECETEGLVLAAEKITKGKASINGGWTKWRLGKTKKK